MRTMYDSVSVSAIPSDAQMVAGYVDGKWPTYDEVKRRFPRAVVVSITVSGRPGAQVVDCEQGDLTPAEAAQWARLEKLAGRHPTIYCSQSPWPAVQAECHKAGLDPGTDVSWWIASYNDPPITAIPPGAIAHQHTNDAARDLDISSVADYWPGVDPVPIPHPAFPHGKPPTDLVSPVWWDDPNDGHAPGWREASHVPAGTFHVWTPAGQRLAYWMNKGWRDPHAIPQGAQVIGWRWTSTGWQAGS